MTTVPGAAAADVLRCVGCSALVPDVSRPTHPYMQASPGCWAVYGEVFALNYAERAPLALRRHHGECYAVQHPGGAPT